MVISANQVHDTAIKINGLPVMLNRATKMVTPVIGRKASVVLVHRLSPALSTVARKVAPNTPQPPSDPMNVLKKKLKIKMEAQIEDQVAQMPPSTPYSLITDNIEVNKPMGTNYYH